MNAAVGQAPPGQSPPAGRGQDGFVETAFDPVGHPAPVLDRPYQVPGLLVMVDVDVGLRLYDVVENPLQRLGERRRRVLHPRRHRAAAAIPTGIAMAVATPPAGSPWISACNSSHSDTNAVPGGSADAASAPTPNAAVVNGIRARSPPSASRSRLPVPCSTDPAARNSSVLNAAWLSTCSRPAASASPASSRCPATANSPAAPTPTSTRPMFSVVEYPSSRLRSVFRAACRIPYTAETAPSASTSSHHQRGPPPSRSNPTR